MQDYNVTVTTEYLVRAESASEAQEEVVRLMARIEKLTQPMALPVSILDRALERYAVEEAEF